MEDKKVKEEIEYLVDDSPVEVDLSHYTAEEIEELFQERFGKYVDE